MQTCRANAHIGDMTTYTIIPSPDGSGFHIGVAGSDGARQTMLGFDSVADAEAWIQQDKRLNGRVDPPVQDLDAQDLGARDLGARDAGNRV
jgi:hypothetical protein